VTNPARSGFVWWVIRYTLYVGCVLLVVVAAIGVGAYREFAADLPDLEAIEQYEALAPGVTRIHAEGGAMLAELAREHRAYARWEDIPAPLVHAFLAAEDRRFFEHEGLDYRGLARALVANVRAGTVSQGGSTITQQVAKGFLSHEQTLARKIREAILSVRMESRLSKERILEIYLNKIFLGHGAYGVAAAASRYFDKPLHELTLAESALIAGMARAPTRYSPFSSLERARARRSVVLQTMVEAGYIDEDERAVADAEPIQLAQAADVFRARAPYYAEAVRRQATELLGEDTVLQDGLLIETAVELPVQRMAEGSVDTALRKIDRRQGWRGPEAHLGTDKARETLRQRTASRYGPDPLGDPDRWVLGLVTKVNKYNAWLEVGSAEALLPLRGAEWAAPYDRNTGINDLKTADLRKVLEPGDVVWIRSVASPQPRTENEEPIEVELGQLPRVEAALYTLDHQTGYVVAMQGGHDYDRSQFNRPIQGCRQPGSVFKAIYYAYALDTGTYAMDTMLEDRPYEPEPGEAWNPQNIHGTLEGKVLLRNAFIHSLNLPSIRLFQRLGANAVVQWARRLGFTTELIADKALSLGASCVRTDELTRAFAIFVRGGRWLDPIYIRRITNKRGEIVLDHRHPWDGAMDVAGRIDALGRAAVDPPHQAIDARTAFLITKMMRDVVTHGIGRRAGRIGVEAGGKSGTASKHEYTTDTWFVGFTSRFVTAAWMGDDTYERSLGNEDASYTTATPMWAEYMARVVADVPHGELTPNRPRGVRSRSVDFQQGAQLRSAVLWFR
jgi:penicillin-binding protein 1A